MKLIVYFACDAGLGSSALGASLFRKQCNAMNFDVIVKNCSVYEIPSIAQYVICHECYLEYVEKNYENIDFYFVSDFMDGVFYRRVIADMLERKKKQEILKLENIILNCHASNSDEAIVQCGRVLVQSNYVTEHYIEGMLNRDHSLTTYIGNDIAIPHGEYEVKDCVLNTGLAVLIYPEGIEWGNGRARVVIGIAAKNDDHMEILANIANALCEMKTVDYLVSCNNPKVILSILRGSD